MHSYQSTMVADLKMVMVGRFHIGSLQEVRNTAPLDFEENHVSRDYLGRPQEERDGERAAAPLHSSRVATMYLTPDRSEATAFGLDRRLNPGS